MNPNIKQEYNAPILVTLGSADQLTQAANQIGSGDLVYSVLHS